MKLYIKIKNALIFGLIAMVFAPDMAFSQACTGNQIEITFQNITTTSTTIEFDVYLKNTGTTALKLAAFAGGLTYSAGTLPAGATGTLTVLSQPSTNDFPTTSNIAPNHAPSLRHLRWSNTPIQGLATSVSMPAGESKKFARLRFTSSLPWDIATTNLTWQGTTTGGYTVPNATVYCESNTNSTALTIATNLITAVNATSIALPLELASFTGQQLESSNMLQWVTISERNVASHVLERSADGVSKWSEIGRLNSKGDSQSQQYYSMEDRAPLTKSYYRLRSVDFDGQESISKMVVLNRKEKGFGIVSTYPNPATDAVTVGYHSTQEGTVTAWVTDVTGRVVLQQQAGTTKGENLLPLDISTLSAGTYFINLRYDSEETEPVRFVKQ